MSAVAQGLVLGGGALFWNFEVSVFHVESPRDSNNCLG